MNRVLLCGFTVALAAMLAPAADFKTLTSEQMTKLERGEVVLTHVETKISDTEQKSLVVGSVIIRQPVEAIWEVVDHPEREKDWIPYVKKSDVVKDERPTSTTRICTIDYRLAGYGLDVYYSLVREYDYKAKTIKGYMDKTRPHKYFLDVRQGWNFMPHKDAIIFQYWSDAKLTLNLPEVVARPLAEKQLAGGVQAIRKRCDFVAQEMKRTK